jgi:aryl-alcohol dehydrogenase-like predicted oxidoreductase
MAKMVEEGLLKHWGVSAGDKDTAVAATRMSPRPSVLQLPFNLIYKTAFTSVEHTCAQYGIGLLGRSVLAHGLLAGFWTQNKTFNYDDHRKDRWTPDQLSRRLFQIKSLKILRSTTITTQRGAAVRYVLDNPRLSSAVLGPKDTVQLDQLIREAGTAPPYLDAVAKRNALRRLTELGTYE